MNKLQHLDLHDVEAYWESRGLVDERHLPYYVRWLQRFFAGSGGDPRLAWEDAQRAFVEQLEGESVPEWQVRQAARAVELYGTRRTVPVPFSANWPCSGGLPHPPRTRRSVRCSSCSARSLGKTPSD